MSENESTPAWVRNAIRVDRPDVDAWYKVEQHGQLHGRLIWRGQQRARSGSSYNAYAIRSESGTVFGVAESAGLRDLRTVSVGSLVFLKPTTIKELEGGRKMQQFEIYAQQIDPLSEVPKGRGTGGGSSESGGGSDGGTAPEEVPF
jgi:hypothetical protein